LDDTIALLILNVRFISDQVNEMTNMSFYFDGNFFMQLLITAGAPSVGGRGCIIKGGYEASEFALAAV